MHWTLNLVKYRWKLNTNICKVTSISDWFWKHEIANIACCGNAIHGTWNKLKILHLTLVKIRCNRFDSDEHVGSCGGGGGDTSTSCLWPLPLRPCQETFLRLVNEQVEVPVVFFQQVLLEIKGWQRGQRPAGRFDRFPSLLGFGFGFDWIFRLGLGLAGGALSRRGAGHNGLPRRNNSVRQSKALWTCHCIGSVWRQEVPRPDDKTVESYFRGTVYANWDSIEQTQAN